MTNRHKIVDSSIKLAGNFTFYRFDGYLPNFFCYFVFIYQLCFYL